jgi:hypothetical protein
MKNQGRVFKEFRLDDRQIDHFGQVPAIVERL